MNSSQHTDVQTTAFAAIDTEQKSDNISMAFLSDMREQIEFYFGSYNFPRDAFLQRVVSLNHGLVPIQIIAQFPKIQQMYFGMISYFNTSNPGFAAPIEVMVCRALEQSQLIALSDDGYFLRPNWPLLQGSMTTTSSHGSGLKQADPLYVEFQHQPVHTKLLNHTDATTTTVSPTSFASGSDGSAGGQPSMTAEHLHSTHAQHHHYHPTNPSVPLVFNPTGGVYYMPVQPNFHHPEFTPHYHPAVVSSPADSYHHIPAPATMYYQSKPVQNSPYLVHQQYLHAPPNTNYYAQTFAGPSEPFNHSVATQNIDDLHQQHSGVQPMKPIEFVNSTQIEGPETVSPSVDSSDTLNAPPAVIRLHDSSFRKGANTPTNYYKQHQHHHQLQQQGTIKKGKGNPNSKNARQRSFQRQESSGNQVSQSQVLPSPQNLQDQSDDAIQDSTEAVPKTNMLKGDTEGLEQVARKTVQRKEKNRVAPPQQPNRNSSASRSQQNRLSTTSSQRQNRDNVQHQHTRSKGSGKGGSTKKKDAGVETIILIDENFPSLTKACSSLPNGAFGKSSDDAISKSECSTKKKYAEALLHNPLGSKTTLTEVTASVTGVETGAIGNSSINNTSTVQNDSGAVAVEVPIVSKLIEKFNLNE